MDVKESIFKSYDIRGVYPQEVNEEIAYRVGRALVSHVNARAVIVGRDMRLSSPQLHDALVRGITEQGADVFDIGLATTDMFYYACGSTDFPGVTVTASHNPKEYNGFKMVRKLPDLIGGGNGMEEIRDMVIANKFSTPAAKGTVQDKDIRDEYRKKILSLVTTEHITPQKIIVDAANGLGGVVFDLVYRDFPIDVVRMYFEPDGRFPNHGGDPLQAKNRKELEARVITEGASLGFAFDPDADRFFVIDEKGEFVPGDFMTALLGEYLVKKYGGGNVVYDLRASWAVRDLITKAGGSVFENRVGHAHIKPRMQEEDAIFGGEVTGHYYFRDFFFSDSGVLPSLVVISMLCEYGKTMSELLAPLVAHYHISGEINSTVADADEVLRKIKCYYEKDFAVHELDGVSIISDEWHANVRKSNTEPLVRLNVESVGDMALMEEKRDELLKLIQSS